MKIILVGYMGSGKSAVGKALAEHTDLPFVDLDDYIEVEIGMPIPEIFREKGEIFFRKMEHGFLKRVLSSGDDLILATGGGTPCYSGNMDLLLKATPHVFYLQMSVPALTQRLAMEKEHRPMISHLNTEDLQEYIGKHLFERREFYSRAPHTIACDGKGIEEVANLISSQLI